MDKSQKSNSSNILKKTWNYLWNGDSILSWVLFIVLVFLVIKFVFFPTLSLVTGTKLPIVIVESCSMYHESDFNAWWDDNKDWYESRGINKTDFEDFPLSKGFAKGDIFFVTGANKNNIKVGDTIIFTSGISGRPIIHRVVNLDPIGTKGDHNSLQFTSTNNIEKLNEVDIKQNQIIGKAASFKIPLLGWIKLIFYEPFRSENERGFCK
ncbi:MAG: hypothetical protein AABX03_01105 [Nanoarchaeota archaeon]